MQKFFGSKLNTVLLLILIVLMIFALRFMYQNQGEYLPSLDSDKVENIKQDEKEDKDLILWRWRNLTFKLPKGWGARSADSGIGGSLLIGRDLTFENISSDKTYIIASSTSDCDYDVPTGEEPSSCISQKEFMDNFGSHLKSPGKLISTDRVVFMNKNAIKQTIELDGFTKNNFYLEGMDYKVFTVPVNIEDTDIILSVFESINFSPSEDELKSARNTP